MKKEFSLTQKDFDGLLGWLSDDREEAGRQYEKIRDGLTRFFRFRGCPDPEMLADETINRVAVKVDSLDNSKGVKTISIFYGFASHIFMEYRRDVRNRDVSLSEINLPEKPTINFSDEAKTDEYDCLEKCLAKLSDDDKKLVINYYSKDKIEKFELRKILAETLHISSNTLYTRVYRIKAALRNCIEKCLKQ